MSKVLSGLEKKGSFSWYITGGLFVSIIGISDYLTGYEIGFSLFYLVPISAFSWFKSKRSGIFISLLCGIIWFLADYYSGHPYSSPVILYWNTGIRFMVFLIVSLLLSSFRETYNHVRDLGRKDDLTGAFNSRYFSELVEPEINKQKESRKPFSLAYIDLDNFKFVNDNYGHSTGDEVLVTIVNLAKNNLRILDVISRLGGDEFALFLPETDQEAARFVIEKLQKWLLDSMSFHNWPVTFSIGVTTFVSPPESIDKALKLSDNLMYEVKRKGKNSVSYSVYP